MLKAVLFDMDGVLIDSEPVHFAANSIMMREKFGIELEYEDYRKFIGSTVEKIWKFYRERYELYSYQRTELMDMAEAVLADMVEKNGYPEIPGAARLVREFKDKGYLVGVASSSPMASIIKNLTALGIAEVFDTIVSGMEIENPKPSPDIFLKAAENLDVKPSECVVIEDSSNGARAAKAANMACMGFVNPNSGNQDLSMADCLFESFLNIDEAFIRMIHNHWAGIPWKVMETERLIIREMSLCDIDRLYEIYEPETITRYMEPLYSQRHQELEYMKGYISNVYGFYGYGMWILETREGAVIGRAGIEHVEKVQLDDNEVLGCLIMEAGCEPESGYHMLGYVVDTEFQSQGYGYEACRNILFYGKTVLFINRVFVKINRENKRSIELAEKLGFIFEY